MSFYDEFSKYYNDIFPLDKNLADSLVMGQKIKNILDIGCATGEYAKYFSRQGYIVDAFDLSKQMIDISVQDNPHNVNFFVSNMITYKRKKSYDLIYCIGSTIAHINTKENLKKFIKNSYDNLREKGVIKIKSLDYMFLFNNGINRLEDLVSANQEVILKRNFEFSNTDVLFKTTLVTKEKTYNSITKLMLLSRRILEDVLLELNISNYSFGEDKRTIFLTITKNI
ncbi:class I SAM-dependent methyltransferase [Acholeplasma sp. OttesenSCG-928-E16]|nr:class I SAM-dependent methyltransferase [Acholeplasma sp. OttesenSCG-928-E16]